MLGTIVNAASVLIGGTIGLVLRKGIPQRLSAIVRDAIGLATIGLSIMMIMKMSSPIPVVLALLIGGVIGECIDLESRFNSFAGLMKRLVGAEGTFIDGMVTAFITFCVGPMTVLGSIEDGLGNPSILFAKSLLDGFMAVAYATSMGVGVVFSVVPLLLYQGSIAALAFLLKQALSTDMLYSLTATGGVLLLGLGVNLLELRRVKVINLLPALALAPLIEWFM